MIELMIVVIIPGILSAIAIPRLREVSRRSKKADAVPVPKQPYTLQERHLASTGGYATAVSRREGGAWNLVPGKHLHVLALVRRLDGVRGLRHGTGGSVAGRGAAGMAICMEQCRIPPDPGGAHRAAIS